MGLKSSLFGSPSKQKSTSTTESGNHAWGPISNAFTPALGYVTQGGNAMSALLGLGGNSAAQKTALDNFANSAGMQFLRDQGNEQITSNQAAKGLLNSGSTLKALDQYGQGLGSTYLNSYMQNLLGLGQLGLGAGGVMANAGQWSKGTSKSTGSGGKQGMLPSLVSAAAMIPGISDERAKTNIKRIGEYASGIPKYSFEFKEGLGLPKGVHVGPLAHEVKAIRPDAFIENFKNGFDGVDYGKLN